MFIGVNNNSRLVIVAISLVIFSGCAQLNEQTFAYSTREPEVLNYQASEEEQKVQQKYLFAVRKKIMSNWKRPFNPYNNREAVVAFALFPDGNINKPIVATSSENAYLDSLAIKAVNASIPFSKFPPELNIPNLNIKIHFRYVNKAQ
jgi:TonB family protein